MANAKPIPRDPNQCALVYSILQENPTANNKQIAFAIGCSDTHVGNILKYNNADGSVKQQDEVSYFDHEGVFDSSEAYQTIENWLCECSLSLRELLQVEKSNNALLQQLVDTWSK